MNTIFVHREGRTEQVSSIDRSWLGAPAAGAGVYLWVDLAAPSIPESLVLTDSFAFHPLAVEQSRAERHWPQIDAYDGYLFAAIAGPEADVGFFVGPQYLVSVHAHESRAVADQIDSVRHGGRQFSEGPFAMFHRLAAAMADGFTPVLHEQAACADALEQRLFARANGDVVRDLIRARAQAFDVVQRLERQGQVIGRLAGRGIVPIGDEMATRFRDVHNRLGRQAADAAAIAHRLGDLTTAGAALASRKTWI